MTKPKIMTQSTLNPNAEEFVPNKVWQRALANEEPPFVTLLKDVLCMLTNNPVAFFDYMTTVADAMNDAIETNEQLEGVADVVFVQSTLEPNFTYTGAKMCHYLIQNLKLPPDVRQFSTFINKRTKDVVVQRLQLLATPDTAETVHGTTFFLAELFLMIEIKVDGKMCRVYPYREALQELMEALVSLPNKSNLKCVGKVVKMIGAAFDDFDREKGNETISRRFQQVISNVKHLVVDDEIDIDKTVKLMWIEIFELRASDWGRSVAPTISKEHVVTAGGDTGGAAAISDEPVFYNADGQVISPDEAEANLDQRFQEDLEEFIAQAEEIDDLQTDFSELGIPSDDEGHYLPPVTSAESFDGSLMDPEAEQAFEEFLHGFEAQGRPKYGFSSRHWSPNS